MKNLTREFIFGKNVKASALFALGVLIFVGLGCFGGRSSDSKPVPSEYFGVWTGQDGSTITIRGDGKGDYKSGGTTVDGGTVEIDDAKKELSITFFGIGPTLKIDSPPSGDTMKLDGITYRRAGGSTTTTTTPSDTKTPTTDSSPATKSSPAFSSSEKADASKGEMPSDGEIQQMVKTSLLDFNDAVQQGDFTDFHSKVSKRWQQQTTPETFNQGFKEFIDKDVDISGISGMEPEFSPQPDITKTQGVNVLEVIGKYDTSPTPTRFELKYIPDGKNWKLFAIKVDTRR